MKRSLALVAATLVVSTANANQSLVADAQTVLDDPKASCAQLNALAEKLRTSPVGNATIKSISARLYAKRGERRCLKPAPPGTPPPPTPTQTFEDVYPKLVDEIREKRAECASNPDCPEAEVRELEIARLTIHLARTLPDKEVARLGRAFQSIVIVLPVTPSVDRMIGELGTASVTEQQTTALFHVLATSRNEAELLRNIAALFRDRKIGQTALQNLLDALCTKNGCSDDSIAQLIKIHTQLSDPTKRKTLERMLKILKTDFPGLKPNAEAALEHLKKDDPGAARAISSLFAAIGPFVLLSVQLKAERNFKLPMAPQSIRFIPMSVVRDRALPSGATCRPDEQFWNTYIEFLHFSFGVRRGFRAPVVSEAADSDEHDALVEEFGKLSKAILGGADPKTLQCGKHQDVCRPPLPGTVLLSMRTSDAGMMKVDGRCWVDSTGERRPTEMSLFDEEVPAGCSKEDEDRRLALAAELAVKRADRCGLFKPEPGPDEPGPEIATTTSSGWYAAAFAGVPYLQDSRAGTWEKVIPSVLDGALLIGAGISFGLAVKYRNDYNAGRRSSLEPSTKAFNTGIGLSIALGVTRLTSGIVYEAKF